jgi:hypothetical protein
MQGASSSKWLTAVHDVATGRDLIVAARIRTGAPGMRRPDEHAPGVRLKHAAAPQNSEAGMTTFDKREEGFEKQFAHDEELRFKANARRNKLLGLWAAGKLGMSGAEAEAYAKEVIVADLEEAGDDDVFRKLRKDFDAKGVKESDHQIRRTMDEFMAQAIAQIKAS